MRGNGKYKVLDGNEGVLFFKNALLIVFAVAALTMMFYLRTDADFDARNKFSREVTVNDIQLYGMTVDDAVAAVEVSVKKYMDSMDLTCVSPGAEYRLTAQDFILSSARDTVLAAYEASEGNVPAEECVFYTDYVIDADKLRDIITDIATGTNKDPVEPTAQFDPQTRTFTYTEGIAGRKLDVDAAVSAVITSVESETFGATTLTYDTVYPKRTADDLRKNTVKIAGYSSVTTNNYNRNRNIELMCSYVDGYVIAPGEVLSINELVGERTQEKGFLAAPAIMDGKRTVDDIGGGICQLSGTLYNAALLANMNIVERHPHSWPSDYLPVGLDSTLDWNTQKDLKIQNTTDYNMYISAYLDGPNLASSNVVRVAIYGKAFPEGVTVKVWSEITETTPPGDNIITYSTSLASGTSRVTVKARVGYRTRVWREFYCDGKLLDVEIAGRSLYLPIRGEITVGRGAAPTPSPTGEPIITEPPQPTARPTDG